MAVADGHRPSVGKPRSEEVAAKFGQNLRACRRRAGISQESLASLAGRHRTEIEMLERGIRQGLVDTLIRLAGALSISPVELLGGIQWLPADGHEGSFKISGQGLSREGRGNGENGGGHRSSRSGLRSEGVAVQFGQNLSRCRRRAALSKSALGRLAGLHRTAILNLEQGIRTARIDTLVRLAGALSISPAELLEGMQWLPPPSRSEGSFSISDRSLTPAALRSA